MNNNSNSLAKLLPMMLCFFAMGFVDLVGIASNYVKADLNLTDSQANIFPSLVFFWFLIFSVPTGMLMNRIGRKKTVLLSLAVTFASLLLPVFGDGYALMLISFSLLGIGNALMQTSLNPLLSNVVSGERLASSLTFGQFVKAIASFLAPYIAMWGATQAIPSLGMGWRVLFPIYMVIAVVAILWLGTTSIHEEKEEGRPVLSRPWRHQRTASHHPAEHERQRLAGQRTGVPCHVRPQPTACHGNARTGILQRKEPHQRRPQGLLRIPLYPHGTLGRTCRTTLQRRTLCGWYVGSQRSASRTLPYYAQRHHGSGK